MASRQTTRIEERPCDLNQDRRIQLKQLGLDARRGGYYKAYSFLIKVANHNYPHLKRTTPYEKKN